MLERLLVKDFQRHTFLEVGLGQPVTVFVGPSGCGKSAALRALKWPLTNKPTGDSFVGRWRTAPYAFSKLWLDGHTIARSRGEGINEYRLDGHRLLPAGAGAVPRPVADLANVGDVNFQGQHDGPFWFLLSPGEVSRRLNDVVDLSAIDASLSEAAARVRKAKVAVEVCTDRLAKAKAERDQTAWAVRLDADIIHAESQFLESEKLRTRRARIDDLVSAIDGATETQKTASDAILDAGRALRLADTAREIAGRADRLRSGLAEIDRLREAAMTDLPDLGQLDRLRKAADAAARRRHRLSALVFGLENLQWEVTDYDAKLVETKDQLAALAGTTCPTCGQPIPTSPCSPRTSTCQTPRPERGPSPEVTGMDYKRRTSNGSRP